jgi:hypothetical protein
VIWLVLVVACLAAGVAGIWLGSWWWLAFVFGSPTVAIAVAALRGERWPVSVDRYAVFFMVPAVFALLHGMLWPWLGLRAHYIVEWSSWASVALAFSLALTVGLYLRFREHARAKRALLWTFLTTLVFSLAALDHLDRDLPQPGPTVTQTVVQSSYAGGYRKGGPTLTIEPSGPYSSATTHDVSSSTFSTYEESKPICLYTHPGALRWRWTHLSPCTQADRASLYRAYSRTTASRKSRPS